MDLLFFFNYFSTISNRILKKIGTLGCARFAEILSELTKTWSSGATECRV